MRFLRNRTIFIGAVFIGTVLLAVIAITIWGHAVLEDRLIALTAREIQGELTAACKDCQLQYSAARFNLFTGRGEFLAPRIVLEDQTKLSFAKVRAQISFSNLLAGVLDLDIFLEEGHAQGVGPKSTTYAFIDQLTKPSTKKPGWVRVRLQNLSITATSFEEPVTRGLISGSGLTLALSRQADDNLVLKPQLEELHWHASHWPTAKKVLIGKLKGLLTLHGGNIKFNQLTLTREQAKAKLTGESNKSQLQGNLSFVGDTASIDQEEIAEGSFIGTAQVSGTLDNPQLNGTLSLPQEPLTIFLGKKPLVTLNSCRADFDYDHQRDRIAISSIEGTGPGATLTQPAYVNLQDAQLNALFTLNLEEFEIAGLVGRQIKATIAEEIAATEPFLPHVKLTIAELDVGSITIPDVYAEIVPTTSEIQISGHNADQTLHATAVIDPTSGNLVKGAVDLVKYKHASTIGQTQLDSYITGQLTSSGGPLLPFTGTLTSSTNLQGYGQLDLSHKLAGSSAGFKLATSAADALKVDLQYGFTPETSSTLAVDLRALPETVNLPNCLATQLALNYEFSNTVPLAGSGSLTIDQLNWGCAPRILKLVDLPRLAINNGALLLKQVALKGFQDKLFLTGSISALKGYDLNLEGVTNLPSVGSLIPSLDNLEGTLQLKGQLHGALAAPRITGEAILADGLLANEQAGFILENLSGSIKVDSDSATFSDIQGLLNQGQFNLTGTIFPFDIAKSRLLTTFDDVAVELSSDTYAVLKGDLKLTADQDLKPTIEGELYVKEGEFRKSFDLKTLAQALTQSLRSTPGLSKPTSLPNIGLNLHVSADRDLFVITNLLEAELNADLNVSGSLDNPQILGTLGTLGGWFGLNTRQFDISNGTLKFGAANNTPLIDIVGETVIRTRIGETTNVVIEAEGPLDNPQIKLIADRDIPQSELVTLLATNQRGVFENRRRRGSTPLSARDIFRLGLPYVMGEFFDRLTQIDYLSIEPTYNLLTSTIQPSMIAEKKLSELTFLRAQALFGGNFTESSLKLLTDYDQQFQLALGIESASTNQNNAITADLAYTVLESLGNDLKIQINGNRSLSDRKIKQIARLAEFSSLDPRRLDVITSRIESHYQASGFRDARVSADCSNDLTGTSTGCSELRIKIYEGHLQKIVAQKIQTTLSNEIQKKLLPSDSYINRAASDELLEEVQQEVTSSLHALGFYRANVSVSLLPINKNKQLTVTIDPGKPVQITFWGAKHFTEKELLKQMQLIKRNRPLGSNTLHRGVENIERFYREHGYLYTSISHQEDELPEALYFHIYIHEEPRVTVSEVNIQGNKAVSIEKITAKMGQNAKNFLEPRYAIAEDIEFHVYELQRIYAELGFPNCKVKTALESGENARHVKIHYYIDEGTPQRAPKLQLTGFPEDLKRPQLPKDQPSIHLANRYIQEVYDSLQVSGYRFAEIWSALDQRTNEIVINVVAGPRTIIGRISVQGNVHVATTEILERLTFKEGDAWNELEQTISRRNLLKTGLFSRVQMLPGDGEIDDSLEDLIVEVVERPLRSLVVGSGANSLFGLHLFGEYADKEIFADGRQLTARADLYVQGLGTENTDISQGIASIIHTNPNLFSSANSLVSDLRFQKLTTLTQEFDVERIATTNLLSFPVSENLTTALGHTLTFDNIVSVPEDVRLGALDAGNVTLGFISGSTTLDLRDYPLNPRNGFTTSVNYQLATPALLSEGSFYRLGLRATGIKSFGDSFSLAALTRWGWADAFGPTTATPITQRFYLGGRASVRGFRENSLGPRGSAGNVIGGELLQQNSLELQYRPAPEIELHTFFDSGGMALQTDQHELWNYRTSVGLGTRYLSPIGPVGFDVGFPLNEREGEPSVRLHFNIGSQF